MILKHLSSTLVGELEHDEVGFLLREEGKAVHMIEKKTNTLIKLYVERETARKLYILMDLKKTRSRLGL